MGDWRVVLVAVCAAEPVVLGYDLPVWLSAPTTDDCLGSSIGGSVMLIAFTFLVGSCVGAASTAVGVALKQRSFRVWDVGFGAILGLGHGNRAVMCRDGCSVPTLRSRRQQVAATGSSCPLSG